MGKVLYVSMSDITQIDFINRKGCWIDSDLKRKDMYLSLPDDAGMIIKVAVDPKSICFVKITKKIVDDKSIKLEYAIDKKYNYTLDYLLRVDSFKPEFRSSSNRSSRKPLVADDIDFDTIVENFENNRFIDFYIVEKKYFDNLKNETFKENDRIAIVDNGVIKTLLRWKAKDVDMSGSFYPSNAFSAKGKNFVQIKEAIISLHESKKGNVKDRQAANLKIIKNIEDGINNNGFYKFNSFTQYWDVIHNKSHSFDEDDLEENDDILEEVKSRKEKYPRNIILYGPPGTGKTYNTVFYALGIIEGKSPEDYEKEGFDAAKLKFDSFLKSEQIEFITFHQNYSYEDFIIGLKPDTVSEQLQFGWNKGLFYKIVERAKKNFLEVKTISFEKAIEQFLDPAKEGKEIIIRMTSGKSFIIYGINEDTIKFKNSEGTPETINKLTAIKIHNNQGEIIKGLEMYYDYLIEEVKKTQSNLLKKYVLIIDEINRANISKVFGELITLIEDDKRMGEKFELSATLANGEKNFVVPPNVYIVGTMNTADKSIALLDVALRRRFSFVGLYPKYDKLTGENSTFLQSVNKEIYKRKQSPDFLIGHSYFMNTDSLENIVRTKVIPLLLEYFSNKTSIVAEIFMGTILDVKYNGETHDWDIRKK